MASEEKGGAVKSHEEVFARVRSLTAGIRDGAAAADRRSKHTLEKRMGMALRRR